MTTIFAGAEDRADGLEKDKIIYYALKINLLHDNLYTVPVVYCITVNKGYIEKYLNSVSSSSFSSK